MTIFGEYDPRLLTEIFGSCEVRVPRIVAHDDTDIKTPAIFRALDWTWPLTIQYYPCHFLPCKSCSPILTAYLFCSISSTEHNLFMSSLVCPFAKGGKWNSFAFGVVVVFGITVVHLVNDLAGAQIWWVSALCSMFLLVKWLKWESPKLVSVRV